MAMAWIWTGMAAVSLIFAAWNGTMDAVGAAALEGAGAAVQLCIAMAGVLCLWSGVMEIMSRCGLSGKLAALLTAVYMLRASGAMDALAAALAPVLGLLGIPPETAALLLVRPVSGSGALAVGSQIMEQYGPDSAVGRTAAVMLGCSETTFYTVAVYFGAAGIRRTRYTIPAALTADLAAFVAAAWAVRLCFG